MRRIHACIHKGRKLIELLVGVWATFKLVGRMLSLCLLVSFHRYYPAIYRVTESCTLCALDVYVLADPEYELLLSEVVAYTIVPTDMDSDSTLADTVLPCMSSC